MHETIQFVAVIALFTAVPVAFFAVLKIAEAVLQKDGKQYPKALEALHTLAQAAKITALALLVTLIGLFFTDPAEVFDFVSGLWNGVGGTGSGK